MSKSSKQMCSKLKKDEEAENEDDEASTSEDNEAAIKGRKKTSKLLDAKLSESNDDSDIKPKTKKYVFLPCYVC